MSAKYIRLADALRALLIQRTDGVYKLPSEQELCMQYQVSRQTVRTALSLLEQEGLIEKRPGSGSYSTGLGAKKRHVVILVNNAEEYTTPSLLSDIKAILREKGYFVTVYSTYSKISREREILKSLDPASFRGLIAEAVKSALPNPNLDLYESLRRKGAAVLFVGSHYPAPPAFPHIIDDNYYGGYLLGRHLIRQGHSRIAGIFQIDDMRGLERCRGLFAALRDFDLPFSDEPVHWYTSAEYEALERRSDTAFLTSFLRKGLLECSAAVCQNDEIAYWLIRELRYANIRIPEELSIVSFDNSYMSELDSIHITSLAHKPHEVGYTAAETLLRIIRGERVTTEPLTWKLTAKGSDLPYER